jgi:hypothetical protein
MEASPLGPEERIVEGPPPTSAELSDGISRLVDEVSAILSTPRWAILNSGTERTKWLLYDAAALRHCCRLLYEMNVAAQTGQEFAVRLLARAHLEAWLIGLYIHFGEFEAVERLAQDTRHNLEATNNDAASFDGWLVGEQKNTRKRVRRVNRANDNISRRNEENPGLAAMELHEAPYVPQMRTTGLDLGEQIAEFANYDAQPLAISELVDLLSKLAREKGFGKESFRPIYIIYRVLSAIGTHATLTLFESYFIRKGFVHTAPAPINGSVADVSRITALQGTAYLACAVLGDQGSPTPVAEELRDRLVPLPTGDSPWADNTQGSAPSDDTKPTNS